MAGKTAIDDKDTIPNYVFAKLTSTPLLAQKYTHKNHIRLKYRRAYWEIKKYIDDFLSGKNLENRFIIMPGLRSMGKTTILFQIYDYLIDKKKIDKNRVLYFSTDEMKGYIGENILHVIDAFIQKVHRTTAVELDEPLIIFVDEAHYDKDWSMTGKIFFDQSRKIFIVFTGSSALDLELNVDAARRASEIRIFPLSFEEHLHLKYGIDLSENFSSEIIKIIFTGNKKAVENAAEIEHKIIMKAIGAGVDLKRELENFLCYGGFPFSLSLKEFEVHEKLAKMTDRVIEMDVFSLQSFSTDTRNHITRIIYFLAMQNPGGTSDAKLSERLSVSPTLVRSILDVLEKTHLIFSVKPYGGAGKIVRKPWKYYFLSPSINASLRYKLGLYNNTDREMLGILAETLVASYFFRIKETLKVPIGIFYDADKEGVDFLLEDIEGKIIPIEVGIGKKNKRQIKRAIMKYKSEYGIVISDTQKITMDENIIYIPLTAFSFI
ncbi:MAG: ATP-binding protein [Candidatus Aenigmarchaeota archaeon]|nr:ATP-binding protein [Candidatus Aenigmarchaeota archaeon]